MAPSASRARAAVGTASWFVVPLSLCPLVALLRPGDAATALDRADTLLGWEQAIGVAIESDLHAWIGARPLLHAAVTAFYLSAHLAAVIATACWLAAYHPDGFVAFRRTFAVAQVHTALIYVAVPVAPLRMLLTGRPEPAGPAWTRSVQYEFAAMPSGHVAFALVVAVAVWQHAPVRWRWTGVAHVACTLVAVVATAHHLLLDAVAAVFVVAVAIVVVRTIAAVSSSGDVACRSRARSPVARA